jgi:hypothetical protein
MENVSDKFVALQWDAVDDKGSVAIYTVGAFTLVFLSSSLVGAINKLPLVRSLLTPRALRLAALPACVAVVKPRCLAACSHTIGHTVIVGTSRRRHPPPPPRSPLSLPAVLFAHVIASSSRRS